jgi:hypothetical protein
MLILLPRIPMLNSPDSACYARIMPIYAQLCRRAGKMPKKDCMCSENGQNFKENAVKFPVCLLCRK